MTEAVRTGGELFIVDNSVSGWTGLRYLQEWCDIAKSFDIATDALASWGEGLPETG